MKSDKTVTQAAAVFHSTIRAIAIRHSVCWDADENVFVGPVPAQVMQADLELNTLANLLQGLCPHHLQAAVQIPTLL